MPDEFLRRAGVAHDIKNLIARACIAVEALKQGRQDQACKQTQRISCALEQIASLCVREFDENLTPRTPQHFSPADVRGLLREAVLVSRKGQDQSCSRISCKVSVEPNLRLTIDSVLLFRILFNLTSNALNAMANISEARLAFHVRKDAGWVIFDVVDNGPGLPDRILAFLYPRVGAEPSRRGRLGTGLMLAVSLAKDLDGELSLVRSGANGSAFRLRVPAGPMSGMALETPVLCVQPKMSRPYEVVSSND